MVKTGTKASTVTGLMLLKKEQGVAMLGCGSDLHSTTPNLGHRNACRCTASLQGLQSWILVHISLGGSAKFTSPPTGAVISREEKSCLAESRALNKTWVTKGELWPGTAPMGF